MQKRKFEPQTFPGVFPAGAYAELKYYLESGVTPRDFIKALLENDLQLAVARAPASLTPTGLFEILAWFRENLPVLAWGTKNRVRLWIDSGGWNGREGVSRVATFEYRVPVHVTVQDGRVCRVMVMSDHPVLEPIFVGGNVNYFDQAARDAHAQRSAAPGWPKWELQHEDREQPHRRSDIGSG